MNADALATILVALLLGVPIVAKSWMRRDRPRRLLRRGFGDDRNRWRRLRGIA